MGHCGQQRCTQRTYGKKKKIVRPAKPQKPQKVKKNLTPGTVLIILAGRYRGRRVVFIKQLDSGLLLVTGPYAVNGVPFRRVNQRYCIATTTKLDLKSTNYESIADTYFAKEKKKTEKKTSDSMFAAEPEAEGASAEKKAAARKMDEPFVKSLADDMKHYLKTRFTLTAHMFPHELKF